MRFKLSAISILLGTMLAAFPVHAQTPNCTTGRPLVPIPEIKSDEQHHRLQATVILSDGDRSLAATSSNGTTCNFQHVRFFEGFVTGQPKPWPDQGDILPGPTLRAHVGDWIELTFLNHVNPKNFPNTLDQGEEGKTPGCDIAKSVRTRTGDSVQIYPRQPGPPWAPTPTKPAPPWGSPPGDTYPNCLHGSSTANIHYHGTHTTPSTTGDNVLLFIHPALRDTGEIAPKDSFVNDQFAKYFEWCEKYGPAQEWTQLPPDWQTRQKELLMHYDATAPYQGVNGNLPADMKLWPKNEHNLNHHPPLWPQYSIGAFPYCFKLPAYQEVVKPDNKPALMGQAPGTHWYHAHKHGSTALNVGNGMTGVFIIEGAYDDTLKNFYKETPQHKNWGLQEQVLMIQQLETALNLLGPTSQNGPPPLSVNGRLNPVVTMKPNQVQLWRIVNGAARTFVEVDSFVHTGGTPQNIAWRQIAQDGVQFVYVNYQAVGKVNAKFQLATANRADLLVKAPNVAGTFLLQIIQRVTDVPTTKDAPATLLTVQVKNDANPIDPPMDFIQNEQDFPKFPSFLADINGPLYQRKPLVFNTSPSSARTGKGFLPRHYINDKLFEDEVIDQCMTLDTAEEWMLENKTTNIAHPFHIHINPFQIVELFQPNLPEAKDPNNKCYVNPDKPETWKPCHPLPAPWVWWDTFNIPTGQQIDRTAQCTQGGQIKIDYCPANLRQYIECSTVATSDGKKTTTCTQFIPGWFKMRSRFVDFTGQYVLHCHILAHEDRGMMELVAVEGKGKCQQNMKSEYSHH